MSSNVKDKKFTFGYGPKFVVNRIDTYFKDSDSLSNSLMTLLEEFQEMNESASSKYMQTFRQYNYLRHGVTHYTTDIIEVTKNVVTGKENDDLAKIKHAFTHFATVLKSDKVESKFSGVKKVEKPIYFIDCLMACNKHFEADLLHKELGLIRKTSVRHGDQFIDKYTRNIKMGEIYERHAKAEESGQTSAINKWKRDGSCWPLQTGHFSLEICKRLGLDSSSSPEVDESTALKGTSSVYNKLGCPPLQPIQNNTKVKTRIPMSSSNKRRINPGINGDKKRNKFAP